MFGYQRNGLCCRIKRSVLRLGLWVHKRFLSITYRRCMTASATAYAKDFLSPIFGYRDRCFVIVIPFMMIFLMECSTTPILFKGLVGFYPKNFDCRISKNYLVRREMACRERRTRPPALPRRPKASAVSLPPICESQLGDNS